jgi:hypothetical protein
MTAFVRITIDNTALYNLGRTIERTQYMYPSSSIVVMRLTDPIKLDPPTVLDYDIQPKCVTLRRSGRGYALEWGDLEPVTTLHDWWHGLEGGVGGLDLFRVLERDVAAVNADPIDWDAVFFDADRTDEVIPYANSQPCEPRVAVFDALVGLI